MPNAPLKACRFPGCPELVQRDQRWCVHHQQPESAARGSAAVRGYGARWQRRRKGYLAKHPLCACGCGHPSTDIDHIVPVAGPNDPRFWDETNWQALWHDCHSRKTARENGGFGNPRKGVGGQNPPHLSSSGPRFGSACVTAKSRRGGC